MLLTDGSVTRIKKLRVDLGRSDLSFVLVPRELLFSRDREISKIGLEIRTSRPNSDEQILQLHDKCRVLQLLPGV